MLSAISCSRYCLAVICNSSAEFIHWNQSFPSSLWLFFFFTIFFFYKFRNLSPWKYSKLYHENTAEFWNTRISRGVCYFQMHHLWKCAGNCCPPVTIAFDQMFPCRNKMRLGVVITIRNTLLSPSPSEALLILQLPELYIYGSLVILKWQWVNPNRFPVWAVSLILFFFLLAATSDLSQAQETALEYPNGFPAPPLV